MPELKHLESREVVAHTTNSQAPLTHRGGQGTKIAPQLKNAHPQGDPNTAQPLEAVPELVDEPVSELPPTLPYWPNPALLQKLLDDNSLLSTEDKELYREMFHAVCFDMQPQSIMQWLLIKDIVDKRFEERRYQRIAVELIEHARRESGISITENDFELSAGRQLTRITNYMPHLSTLSRMAINCANSRRADENDLDRTHCAHKPRKSPSVVPE